MPTAALALAGLGALGYGSASVLQAVAARGGQGTLRIIARPAYLIGTGLDILAWLCSLAALRTLPVFQVQGVLACSLAVTAVVARVVLGERLGRLGVLAVALSVLSLLVLAAAAGPDQPMSLDLTRRAALAGSVLPIMVAGWFAARARHSLAAAGLAGLAFGGAALCARAITVPSHGDLVSTAAGVALDPLAWALAGFGVTGILLYATALEHGDPARATAMLWLAEVAAPSVVGVTLLGDSVRPGRGPAAVCAVVLGLAAAWLLTWQSPPHPASVQDDEAPLEVIPEVHDLTAP
jgi:drug/metabolite transporter (DMT)-like permease